MQTASQYAQELRRYIDQFPGTLLPELGYKISKDAVRLEEESKYNGWPNYETWLVNLHLTNDQYLSETVTDLLALEYEYPTTGKIEALKALVEAQASIDDPDAQTVNLFQQDLVNAALSEVDWQEIVESWES